MYEEKRYEYVPGAEYRTSTECSGISCCFVVHTYCLLLYLVYR